MRVNLTVFASALVLATSLGACSESSTRAAGSVKELADGRTTCGELAADDPTCGGVAPAIVNQASVGRSSCGELAADGTNCAGVVKDSVAAATARQ